MRYGTTYIVRPFIAVQDAAEASCALGGRHPVVGRAGVVLLREQMKVRCSVRATSFGACDAGSSRAASPGSTRSARPLPTAARVRRSRSSSEPSHQTTSSGRHSRAASSTQRRTVSLPIDTSTVSRPWPSGQTLRRLGYYGGHHDSGCRSGPRAIAPPAPRRAWGSWRCSRDSTSGGPRSSPGGSGRLRPASRCILAWRADRARGPGRGRRAEPGRDRALAVAARPGGGAPGPHSRPRGRGRGAGHPLLGARRRGRRWRERRRGPVRAGRGAGGGARPRRDRDRTRLHVRPPRRPPVPASFDRTGARRVRRRSHAGAAGGWCPVQPRAARGGGGLVGLHERLGGRGRDPPADAADRRARRRDLPEPRARDGPGGPGRGAARGYRPHRGVACPLARRPRDPA